MLMRRVEREYYDKELLIHKTNLRKSWEIIKYVIKKKKRIDLPDKFNIDNVMVTDKLEIALNFNNFYVNIGTKLSNDIPTNSGDPLSYIKSAVPDSIFVESVDESEIINICKNMKDCCSGWDQILLPPSHRMRGATAVLVRHKPQWHRRDRRGSAVIPSLIAVAPSTTVKTADLRGGTPETFNIFKTSAVSSRVRPIRSGVAAAPP